MKKTNGQSGITLIALVVTIVVLLILAGITITYVLSDGGIFATAKESAIETEKGAIKDYTTNVIVDCMTAYYTKPEAERDELYTAAMTNNFPAGSVTAPTGLTVTSAGVQLATPVTVTMKSGNKYTLKITNSVPEVTKVESGSNEG